VDTLADAVKVTLGPKGRHVVLDQSFGPPRISKDGVIVAKEIELPDRFENIGAQLVKQVALRTSELGGSLHPYRRETTFQSPARSYLFSRASYRRADRSSSLPRTSKEKYWLRWS
jgi:hypothetical protein